jgi:hypothetical protein
MEKSPVSLIEEKLNAILETLERLDRRDRWRTMGGFLRTIIGLIPLAIFLWFLWYGVTYSDQILEKLISMTAEQVNKTAQQTLQPTVKGLREINLKDLDLSKLVNP